MRGLFYSFTSNSHFCITVSFNFEAVFATGAPGAAALSHCTYSHCPASALISYSAPVFHANASATGNGSTALTTLPDATDFRQSGNPGLFDSLTGWYNNSACVENPASPYYLLVGVTDDVLSAVPPNVTVPFVIQSAVASDAPGLFYPSVLTSLFAFFLFALILGAFSCLVGMVIRSIKQHALRRRSIVPGGPHSGGSGTGSSVVALPLGAVQRGGAGSPGQQQLQMLTPPPMYVADRLSAATSPLPSQTGLGHDSVGVELTPMSGGAGSDACLLGPGSSRTSRADMSISPALTPPIVVFFPGGGATLAVSEDQDYADKTDKGGQR
jgi:hypothetical protein